VVSLAVAPARLKHIAAERRNGRPHQFDMLAAPHEFAHTKPLDPSSINDRGAQRVSLVELRLHRFAVS
jgi:hypothetical protein